MRKIVCCLLICTIFILYFLPFSISVNAAASVRYGYSLLETDMQRLAYASVAECVALLKPSAEFKVSGVTKDNVKEITSDIELAVLMMYKDYPEYFWYDGGCAIRINGETVKLVPNTYYVDATVVESGSSKLENAQRSFNNAVKKALGKIDENMSDYEIAHTIHDYLIDLVTYEAVGDHQSAYGALVNHKAVCAGYTRAFQVLMNAAGIPCWHVSGKSYDPNGELFGHAWNMVWLDGMCYYTDVTWDDQLGELFHEYMNLSKEEISKTHFTNDPLPTSCGHDAYTFFIRNDGKGVCDFHGHRSEKEIAGCFELRDQKGDIATYYCTIHYHGDDFTDWFNLHKVGIINELGLDGSVSCNIIKLGLEHHVTFTGKVEVKTQTPTENKTELPSEKPTQVPTERPTKSPINVPAEMQTEPPTQTPTEAGIQQGTESAATITTIPTVSQPLDEHASQKENDMNDGTGAVATFVVIVGVCAAIGVYFLYMRKKK